MRSVSRSTVVNTPVLGVVDPIGVLSMDPPIIFPVAWKKAISYMFETQIHFGVFAYVCVSLA